MATNNLPKPVDAQTYQNFINAFNNDYWEAQPQALRDFCGVVPTQMADASTGANPHIVLAESGKFNPPFSNFAAREKLAGELAASGIAVDTNIHTWGMGPMTVFALRWSAGTQYAVGLNGHIIPTPYVDLDARDADSLARMMSSLHYNYPLPLPPPPSPTANDLVGPQAGEGYLLGQGMKVDNKGVYVRSDPTATPLVTGWRTVQNGVTYVLTIQQGMMGIGAYWTRATDQPSSSAAGDGGQSMTNSSVVKSQ